MKVWVLVLWLFLLFKSGLSFGVSNQVITAKKIAWQQAVHELNIKPTPLNFIADDKPVTTLFTMHGSNTLGENLSPNLALAYLREKGVKNVRIQPLNTPNEKVVTGDYLPAGKAVQIHISAHGSSTGYKSLLNGDAQIWASSRPVKEKEVLQAQNVTPLKSAACEHVVAIDGLAIVVHPNNPINKLSKQQLRLVFSGQLSNWSELGGFDRAINLYARDENSGTWDSFKNMVLTKESPLSTRAQRFESSHVLVQKILIDPAAIGFIGLAFVGNSKLLAVSDGGAQAFKPSLLTVATEDYALSRRLFLYTHDQPINPYVNEFIRFVQAFNGQDIVKQRGFISQNVEAMNTPLADDLPVDYLQLVSGNQRLSLNFRFNAGSAQLDNKAVKDIQRLAYFVKQLTPQRELILIGFGDKRKTQSRSKLLSKLRAMAVRRELARLGVYAKLSTGYGEFNPVAGYADKKTINSGEHKNRRVEVWLR